MRKVVESRPGSRDVALAGRPGTERALRWIVCALPLVLVFFAAGGCSKTQQATVDQAEIDQLPDQEGWDSVVEVTEAGKLQAVIRYGHMLHWPKKKLYTFGQGVEADFYDRQGRHASHARADSAVMHEDTNTVDAYGNVVVVSDSGIVLRTNHLRWLPDVGKVQSDVEVQITTAEGDTLYGVGFESEADLSHWRLLKPHGVTKKRVDFEAIEQGSPADTGGSK